MKYTARLLRAAALPAAALGVLSLPVHAAEFGAGINANFLYVDNILQTPNNDDKVDDMALQLNPVLTFSQDNSRVQSSLRYTAQALFFDEQSDLDETFHQLDADSDIHIVADYFDLRLRANMWQQLVDPGQQLNYQNLFSTRNLLDATSGSAEPVFDHEFGPVRVQASYRYGVVNYSGSSDLLTAQDDAVDKNGHFSLGSADRDARFTWIAHYDTEKSDYDISQDFRYDQAGAQLELGLSPSFRLIAEGGSETDLSVQANAGEGGLDSEFWRGGFRWQPDRNNLLEVTAGERFFGDWYTAAIEHRAKIMDLRLRYSEEPTTEARRQLSQFASPGVPGTTPPDVPDVPDTTRLLADAYLHKQAVGHLRLTGRRTTIALRAWSDRREYLVSELVEDGVGAELSIIRQLSARNQVELFGWSERTDLFDGNESRDVVVRLGLSRRFSPNLSAALYLSHVSEEGLNPYDANIASLGFHWTIR